jgi:hypothetical protein
MRLSIVRHDFAARASSRCHNQVAKSLSAGNNPPATRNKAMTRVSSLLLATGLAILPIGAFAQSTAAPTTTPAPMGQATAASPDTTKAPASKKVVSAKVSKPTHAKLGTTAPAAPVKATEPGKS